MFFFYSVLLNRSREWFCQDKKSFNYEHLNFPGKELNVTDITEQYFLEEKQKPGTLGL